MSTPAEIIAARINGKGINEQESLDQEAVRDSSDSEEFNSSVDRDDESSMTTSTPSIADESAYPVLGGKKSSNFATSGSNNSWGPSMKSPTTTTTNTTTTTTNFSKSPTVSGSKFNPSAVQEAFSLDADDQLNVIRPEFIKILTTIKSTTNTNIECSTSQKTKRRTFLITGTPDTVKLAKRLVIKKLTKPIKLSFSIPTKLRYKVIGPRGETLKPIIEQYEVKIDIGHEEKNVSPDPEDDDIFNNVVNVIVEGDAESSKLAKNKILSIISQETKNLSIKIPIEEQVKPFAASYLEGALSKYQDLDIFVPDSKSSNDNITIIGEREQVKKAVNEFKDLLSQLSNKIVVEEVPIPKIKHQFLPIDSILEEENVLIKLPNENETNVKFIGEKSKIVDAKEKARRTTSQYKVEVMDMSKAHKGKIDHVKAVAKLLGENGTFSLIGDRNNVAVNYPDTAYLENGSNTSIPIEIVVELSSTADENIRLTKKEIVSTVNRLTPDSSKVITDIHEFFIKKVPSSIGSIAKEQNVSFIILNNRITLFGNDNSEEDFDFESSEFDDGFAKVDEALNPLRELKSKLDSTVLSIPQAKQKFISGPNQTTLNLILDEIESNSVVIKLGSNDKGLSKDEVYVYGLKDSVGVVSKLINSVISEGDEFDNKYGTSAEVPSSVLSRLIGKNGSFMNSLKDEFGIKIDVHENDNQAEKDKVEIKLLGYKRNVEAGKLKIISLSKKWADETLARLKIENQYHRRMIGPNGVYVNRLQEKYGVRIRFPSAMEFNSNSTDSPRNKDEVTIRGASKNVRKAEEELNDLFKYEKENGYQENLTIPVKAIPRVVGKGGQTINDIADDTGIEYKLPRDDAKEAETGVVELVLTGSKTGLKSAISKINEIVEEAENFVSITLPVESKYCADLVGQGGSKKREIISNAGGDTFTGRKYYRLLSIPNEDTTMVDIRSEGPKDIVNHIIEQVKEIVSLKEASIVSEFDVSKDKHKFVLGPGGSTKQELEREFNVKINIPRPNSDSTMIKVTGLPEKIDSLKEKLNDLTKDDWNESIDIPAAYQALISERGAVFKQFEQEYNVTISHGNDGRKAAKLSNAPFPNPPSEAFPLEEEQSETKFTITPSSLEVTDTTISWRLKGDNENTKKVLKLLTEKLDLAKSAQSMGWFYFKNPSFSRIVGPQGSTVNNIRNKSKVFISVPRSSDKNKNFIYLFGDEASLNTAKSLIEKLI